MGVTYFKRFRMEMDLTGPHCRPLPLPAGYEFIPWSDELLETHAEVKYRCFRAELDADVFPSLGAREGCRRLMNEIFHRQGFMAGATWLLQYWPADAAKPDLCGTVQGVYDESSDQGAIQNLGITPAHRGLGLGSALLAQSLIGFWRSGLSKAYLEVTARNSGAVRLYERLGFRKVKTVYKASDVAYV